MSPSRIIFMGTPDLAGASLQALLQSPEFEVAAVVTQPDQPKGRGLKLQASPVKEIALQKNLPVLQPERARDENFIRQLHELKPDLIAVAAYGQILPQAILELPRFGCLNVHTSLLPKYRGAAPIQWAILNGDAETGVTIMKMDAGLDTGAMLSQEKTPIRPEDNSQTLHERLGKMGADLLVKTIPAYVSGKIRPQPQPADGVTHAPKIKKQDGQIDWSQPSRAVWNRVRAMVPWPGAFTHLSAEADRQVGPAGRVELVGRDVLPRVHPLLLKIWEAELVERSGPAGQILQADKQGLMVACGNGAVRLITVQREGGRRLAAQEFLAGHPLAVGQKID